MRGKKQKLREKKKSWKKNHLTGNRTRDCAPLPFAPREISYKGCPPNYFFLNTVL